MTPDPSFNARQGSISLLPAGQEPAPARIIVGHPGDESWQKTISIWNWQQGFDDKLHRERRLAYPWDFPDGSEERGKSTREWILNAGDCLLEELDEVADSRDVAIGDDDDVRTETVDAVHFLYSLAAKLMLQPQDLGRFEDGFDAARQKLKADGVTDWKTAWRRYLPEYVKALAMLNGGNHKHWKTQPTVPDIQKAKAALLVIQDLNFRTACLAFPDAQAMFDKYAAKVQENHARQEGKVAARADYKA